MSADGMKLRIAVCCLSLVCTGFCACPVIPGDPPQVSQHLIVHVLKQGRTVADAKISVFGPSGPQPQFTTVTDSAGAAKLPTLRPGVYSINAEFQGGAASETLTVKQKSFAKPTQLRFTLEHYPSKLDLVAAQNVPVLQRTNVFIVAIKDMTGAPVADASVQVYKKGEMDEWNGTLLHTDQAGQVSAPLPDGEYVAFIQSPGFHSETIAFEINSKADRAPLAVTLKIGYVC